MRRRADHYRPPEMRRHATRQTPDADPEERPGVPREATPASVGGADPAELSSQPGRAERPSRAQLDRATPVFGTAQPYHGTSGRVRRLAYSIPEHRGRHWLLLMAADRIDVLEDRIGGAIGGFLGAAGLVRMERRVRDDPLPLVAGAAVGAFLVRRLLEGEDPESSPDDTSVTA